MNKFLLSVAACSILASSAFAQVSTTNTTGTTNNEKVAPATNQISATPAAPTSPSSGAVAAQEATAVKDVPAAVDSMKNTEVNSVTNTTPVVGTATLETAPANTVVPAVEPVSAMPSIDQSFFNSLVDSFNSKNVDGIVSAMSESEVLFITSTGIVIRDKEAIKNHLIAMMTGDNPVTLALSVEGKLEPKPGVAFTTGSLTKTTNTMPEQSETHKETISALVNYENGEWKISALQSTKVEEPKPLEPAQEEKSQSSGIRTLLALFIGAAAGFMGARFMAKKAQA